MTDSIRRSGRTFSIDSAAMLLKKSRRTIYNMIRDGRLDTIRTIGGSQRVTAESLVAQGWEPAEHPTGASAVMMTGLAR